VKKIDLELIVLQILQTRMNDEPWIEITRETYPPDDLRLNDECEWCKAINEGREPPERLWDDYINTIQDCEICEFERQEILKTTEE